jgi:hypothetical protein
VTQFLYDRCHQVEEVQEILRTSRTSRCTEKSGWFVFGTDDRIRDLLTELINEQISKERETERSALSDEVFPYFALGIP